MERIEIGNNIRSCCVSVGAGESTKINLIVGTNDSDEDAIQTEMRKVALGVELGVHTITDLSRVRLDYPIWRRTVDTYPRIAVGMNPPNLVFRENGGSVPPRALLREIVRYVDAGGDFMTMNLFPRSLRELQACMSTRPDVAITSRQGGFLARHMLDTGSDNPYWDILPELMPLFRERRITVNIGATFRPIGVAQAFDAAHKQELTAQIEIFRAFEAAGVQSVVETMSHQPLSEIGSCIRTVRDQVGAYVPMQLLGPVVTDIGGGEFDHLAGAIGAAEAARHNAGKVTVIPSNEHVRYPTFEDVRLGIKATLLAVQAGDLSRRPELMAHESAVLYERVQRRSCNPESAIAGCDKCGRDCPLILAYERPRSRRRTPLAGDSVRAVSRSEKSPHAA